MARACLILAFGALLGSVPLSGHHSFAAFYFEDQTVAIEGHVVEFEYRNPHAWVHIQALDASGQMQRVSAEWANPNRLSQQGITKDTVKPGDHVIITGSPARNPSDYKMHLKGIERRTDGWKWSGGRGQRR